MLVEMRIEFESIAFQTLSNGLELFLVLESHQIQQVIKQRSGLDFIESAEGDLVGSLRITDAEWVEDYGLNGSCCNYTSGKGVKKANFYAIAMPNGSTWNIGSANNAKNGFFEVDLWLIDAQWDAPWVDADSGG